MSFEKIISCPEKLVGELYLPASKSISNRVLLIQALTGYEFSIINLSDAEDTKVFRNALKSTEYEINVGNAGTAFRFLTAYFSLQKGERVLTGNERMMQRPVEDLVRALQDLGAEIDYLNISGYPPLKIVGGKLKSKELIVNTNISSQFLSALMLIAPLIEGGLTIIPTGKRVSYSYIDMTLSILNYFGISVQISSDVIRINKQNFEKKDYFVESDWSSLVFWYVIISMYSDVELHFPGFKDDSCQGDSMIQYIMNEFGITTKYTKKGLIIKRSKNIVPENLELNLENVPDMIPAMIILGVIHQIPFRIYGTEHLKYKESDRILSISNELKKIGCILDVSKSNEVKIEGKYDLIMTDDIEFDVYNDHRLAMSFALLSMKYKNIVIKSPDVVKKSYPGFWEDIKRTGFKLSQVNEWK